MREIKANKKRKIVLGASAKLIFDVRSLMMHVEDALVLAVVLSKFFLVDSCFLFFKRSGAVDSHPQD